jgi:hypothetical protein
MIAKSRVLDRFILRSSANVKIQVGHVLHQQCLRYRQLSAGKFRIEFLDF